MVEYIFRNIQHFGVINFPLRHTPLDTLRFRYFILIKNVTALLKFSVAHYQGKRN